MVRKLLFVLVTLFTISGQAQSWCPPGATWTFGYESIMSGYYGVERVEYVGDTVVGGQLAQRLLQTEVVRSMGSSEYVSTSYSSLYTYLNNGVVYLWDDYSGYDTLMWFNAAPGQRWNAPGGSSMYLEVLDTATVLMEGVPLKRLIVGSDYDWFTDTLYERIGFLDLYLAGWSWGATDMPWTGLMCYEDDNFSFTKPGVNECGFTLSVPEQLAGTTMLPLPNPGSDHFSLSLPSGPHTITLLDAMGRVVHQQRVNDDHAMIQTAHLPSGIYLVKVDEALRPVHWVKE